MDSQERNKTIREEGISKFAFERVEAAYERNLKRLLIIIFVLLAMLTAAIAGFIITIQIVNNKWLNMFAEYDFESYELDADGGSIAAYAGDTIEGDINNGGKNKSPEDDKTEWLTGENYENES